MTLALTILYNYFLYNIATIFSFPKVNMINWMLEMHRLFHENHVDAFGSAIILTSKNFSWPTQIFFLLYFKSQRDHPFDWILKVKSFDCIQHKLVLYEIVSIIDSDWIIFTSNKPFLIIWKWYMLKYQNKFPNQIR